MIPQILILSAAHDKQNFHYPVEISLLNHVMIHNTEQINRIKGYPKKFPPQKSEIIIKK